MNYIHNKFIDKLFLNKGHLSNSLLFLLLVLNMLYDDHYHYVLYNLRILFDQNGLPYHLIPIAGLHISSIYKQELQQLKNYTETFKKQAQTA
jgi:hypothetical protein